MRLPHSNNTLIPENKITDYLLNYSHAEGGSKAVFFGNFGFNNDNIADFARALLSIAKTGEVQKAEQNPFGMKYVIDGILQTPDKRNPVITTVWIIENDSEIPKLVTAYPK